jgi:hypothetical protein
LHVERQDGVNVHEGCDYDLKDEGNAKSNEDTLKVPDFLIDESSRKDKGRGENEIG